MLSTSVQMCSQGFSVAQSVAGSSAGTHVENNIRIKIPAPVREGRRRKFSGV